MKFAAAIVVFSLAACATPGSRADRLVLLDRIAEKCNLPKSTFKLVGIDELHFQPSPDAKYEDVACALTELRKSPFPMRMGFVGNEEYRPENAVKAPQ